MKTIRLLALVCLAILAVSASVGAVFMLLHPGGDPVRFPVSMLRFSHFHSFLFPGMLLLVANGLLAFGVLLMLELRRPHSGLWTSAQGCVLLGWLGIECILLRAVVWLHYFYGALALALVCLGWILWREEKCRPVSQG